MNDTNCLEASPLFRMRNRRKLAKLLNLPEHYFKQEWQRQALLCSSGRRTKKNPEKDLQVTLENSNARLGDDREKAL